MNQKGQVALIAVLVISAAALVVALVVSSIGLNESLSGNNAYLSERSFQIADSCAEEAFLRLRREFDGVESPYTGGTLNFGTDSCTITVTTVGLNRDVDVTATVNGKINRKISATVQMSPSYAVTSWQESQ